MGGWSSRWSEGWEDDIYLTFWWKLWMVDRWGWTSIESIESIGKRWQELMMSSWNYSIFLFLIIPNGFGNIASRLFRSQPSPSLADWPWHSGRISFWPMACWLSTCGSPFNVAEAKLAEIPPCFKVQGLLNILSGWRFYTIMLVYNIIIYTSSICVWYYIFPFLGRWFQLFFQSCGRIKTTNQLFVWAFKDDLDVDSRGGRNEPTLWIFAEVRQWMRVSPRACT